jgi:hypothetical protein
MDWAIKRRLFERQLARRGIEWSSLPHWNKALGRLAKVWHGTHVLGPFMIREALERHPLLAAEQARQAAFLARNGLRWEQLADLDVARQEVFELDARFGALGDAGLFNALEAAGAVRHQVGLDVDGALTTPPQDTRARIRGEVVRRLSDAGVPYGAEWTSINDWARKLTLDLHDPFEREERWSDWNSLEPLLGARSGA